jgi:hypothetical protein
MIERWEELYSKTLKSIKFENPSLVQQMILNAASKDGANLEREKFLEILQQEQERTKLGFIQYQRIKELLEENK